MFVQNPGKITQLNWTDYHKSVRRISAKYNPNQGNYRIHDHEFVEIVLITEGTCLHHTKRGDSRPGTGDVFLFRPGAWHGYAEAQGLSSYNCCFDTALLGRELSWMIDSPLLSRLLWSIPLSADQYGMVSLHLPPKELSRCRRLLDELCALDRVDYMSYFADRLGLLMQILSVLARNLTADGGTAQKASHRTIVAALKLIDEAPTEPWTLKTLAQRVHVEPTYFVRLFHSVVGLPPMAYINRRRLELATTLLRRSDLPIGEVGAMSGWLDANYFSRRFRAHFGMTPSRYRTRYLKEQ